MSHEKPVDSRLLPSENATKVAIVRIAASARKHGITDEEMLHAIRNRKHKFQQEDGIWLYVGSSGSGVSLIEVAVLRTPDGGDLIIHAMKARSKFLP